MVTRKHATLNEHCGRGIERRKNKTNEKKKEENRQSVIEIESDRNRERVIEIERE